MDIGFIGLGNIGAPMAANLVKAGHTVQGFDLAPVTAAGVTAANSAAEAAAGKDAVITMLTNGDVVLGVHDEIIPAMRKGSVLIDCSTIDVASAKAAHEKAAEARLLSVDAPVSGGVTGAEAGTLTFMAGGAEDAFAAAEPLFGVMGGNAVLCGGAGAGQIAKICNNMICGATMIAVCESFALAEKLGLDQAKMFDVVSTSSGSCWAVNKYCPVPGIGPQSPSDNEYKPGFAAELMLKDLNLSQQAAESVNAPTPMGALAAQIYTAFVNDGGGKGMDFSAMLPRLHNAARGDV